MKPTGFLIRLISLFLLGASSLAVLITLAGYAGDYRYLEITADYRPYQLGIGLVCLLTAGAATLFFKKARLITTAIACGILATMVNAFEVLPVALSQKPKSNSEHQGIRFKALAFNVEGSNKRFAATREWVEHESPDIAMFCEVHGEWAEELAGLEKTLPNHTRIDAMDIEVFSRYQIIRTQVFHFGPERGFAALDLAVENRTLVFVAVHTYPRYWRGAGGFHQRNLALIDGLGRQASTLGDAVLVMGDLNASPWSPAYQMMIKTSGFQNARDGFGLAVTQHGHGMFSKWLWRPIDHCLHTTNIETERFWTGPDLGSDHLPILSECVLPENAALRKNGIGSDSTSNQ